jgi:hypothetical protein
MVSSLFRQPRLMISVWRRVMASTVFTEGCPSKQRKDIPTSVDHFEESIVN